MPLQGEFIDESFHSILQLEGNNGLTSTLKKVLSGDGVESPLELSTTSVRVKNLAVGNGSEQIVVIDGSNILKKINISLLSAAATASVNQIVNFTRSGNDLLLVGSLSSFSVSLDDLDFSSQITDLSTRVSVLEANMSSPSQDRYLSAINFPIGTDVATFNVANSSNLTLNLARYNYDARITNVETRVTNLETIVMAGGSNVVDFTFNPMTNILSLVTDTPATFTVDLSSLSEDAAVSVLQSQVANHETRITRIETISPDSLTKAEQTIVYSATPTWNYQESYNKFIDLTGNATLAITNSEDGDYGTIRVQATGAARMFTVPLGTGGKIIKGLSPTVSILSGETYLFCFARRGAAFYWTFEKYA